jgi:parvulin-like peptidyl-prolyl isomerase
MLTKLRAQTKFWMWIVGGAFMLTIVFAWGMDFQAGNVSSTLGRVNGRKITIQEYQAILQQNYQYQRDQLGGIEMDDTMLRFIQEQTWQQLVDEILIIQELQELGLTASDQEVLFVLRDNPPAEVRQLPEFQTDGIFDPQKYEAAMGNEAFRSSWLNLEYYVRGVIPQHKLQHIISSTVLVTQEEARDFYQYRNEQVTAQFVSFSPATHPDTTIIVTEAEIGDYYDGHREEFQEPARVDLNYVLLYKDPSARDLETVRETLADLEDKLATGQEFGFLARLGWINPGDMIASFDEVAFLLAEGSISQPVRSQYGWHIVKVDSIRNAGADDEQRFVRHILLREEPSGATLDSLRDVLVTLRYDAEESDFTTATLQLGLEVNATGPVEQGAFVPGIGFETAATQFGFASRVGTISDVMEHDSAYYVIQVRNKLDAGIARFETVHDRIKDNLHQEKTINALSIVANRVAREMQTAPHRFTEIAEAESLIVADTGSFTRNDYVNGVGRDPEFIAVAFTIPIGEVSAPLLGENAWYIIRVSERIEASGENVQSLVDAERQRLLQERRRSAFNSWLMGLRESARIVDNRSMFFGY